ncbi:hypothetical protein ACIRVF_15535 [Kitasatospora sp. NPDC101157]|uniref:hypothetical protein n=1 Tax=Kitasatospora sp. NPDC101157 TaxID=3364098 RepID=UPI003812F6F9
MQTGKVTGPDRVRSDALAPVSTEVVTQDGSVFPWLGFSSGPRVLSAAEVEAHCRLLLGHGTDRVAERAAAELLPSVEGRSDARPAPAVILHSATRTTRGFEGDLADVVAGRNPYDVPGYLESRAVSLAREGDLAVGRLGPWREAVEHYGVAAVDLGRREHYYLSDALLTAAAEADDALRPLIDWVGARPDAVVRLYALDLETQVFLLWLKERAGLTLLRVDANGPVVSADWNRKDHIHPSVADALRVDPTGLDPDGLLAREQRQSDAYRRLGLVVPVLPGYLVPRDRDAEAFVDAVLAAARLLSARYGLERGCLKPCEAGDGARIVAGLDLHDEVALARCAREAHRHGDAYLLEAHVEFLDCEVAGRRFIITPSGHITGGRVAEGLTLQLMNGCSWEGNATLLAEDCAALGVPGEHYLAMTSAVEAVLDAFRGPAAEALGCADSLVTGGIDFAVGRIGGRFEDRIVSGTIDFNLSSHGAVYMRRFQDALSAPGRPVHVATRVYRPSPEAGLATTAWSVERLAADGRAVQVVASVPGRWGMVGVSGSSTADAVAAVEDLVRGLRAEGLVADELGQALVLDAAE